LNTYIHTYRHTYIQTYIHTYRHTYIHTDRQTDHVIYECKRLSKERERIKRVATRNNPWPINKRDLLRRQYNEFKEFINEIQFD